MEFLNIFFIALSLNFLQNIFPVECIICNDTHHPSVCYFPLNIKRCEECLIPIVNNIEDHQCKGATIESIRDNTLVLPTKKFFQLKIPHNDAVVHCYDQNNRAFGEFLSYMTLSSASTNGLFNMQKEGDNALLCYESTQFFKFSIFFAIIMAENQPAFSLRAVTSQEHGLMLFNTNNPTRQVNNQMKIPQELLQCTALFVGLEVKGDNFTIEVEQNGMPTSSIQWSSKNGWAIPMELDGKQIATNVSTNALNISEYYNALNSNNILFTDIYRIGLKTFRCCQTPVMTASILRFLR